MDIHVYIEAQCIYWIYLLGITYKCHSINITLLGMVSEEGILPFHIKQSGPAIDIALESMRPKLPAEVNLTYIQRTFPASSCKNNVAAIAAEVYWKYGITAMIGPGCSDAVIVVGRMAAAWNIPIISPVATASELGNKNDFTTLTRLAHNMNKWAKIYTALFEKYEWTDIAIIHDMAYIFFTIVGNGLYEEFEQRGMRVHKQSFDSRAGDVHDTTIRFNMGRMLQKASEKSRVIVLALYGDDLRITMLTARRMGMTNGEYVFVFARIFRGDGLGDTTWKRGDEYDEEAREAYEAVLITQPRRPNSPEFLDFEQRVIARSLSDYNYTFGDREVNVFITAFHDAFLLYADVLNETLNNGDDITDGQLFKAKVWGRTFNGIGGDIILDDKGDREMDYSLIDMDSVTGEYQVVANYRGKTLQLEFNAGMSIHWPNGAGPPPNVPHCGFLGDDPECQPKTTTTTEITTTVVSVGTVLIAVMLVAFLLFRRYKREAELQSQWWKVKWADVKVVRASVSGSRMSNLQAYSRVETSINGNGTFYSGVALYRGVQVVIRKLNLTTVKTDRNVLTELKDMRDIPCNNLARFHGLCTEEGWACILLEHCSRGSLQDMLHNDELKLDKDFKISLMNDIISGVCYMHGSSFGAYGRLNSSNCLIDGRFVLKLTDFGIPSIRAQEQVDGNFNKQALLYVAPELFSVSGSSGRSMPGDVYSFAILVCELFSRLEPFQNELANTNIDELLTAVQGSLAPLRPSVPSDSMDPSLLKLVEECWSPIPGDRPTMVVVKRRNKELFRNKSDRNILDMLLQRMEQYANNLEGLVEDRTQALVLEKRKSEELLMEILPRSIADKLMNGLSVEPEEYQSVTIYFSDIVGFTSLSASSTPRQVVDMLNDLYTCFDKIIEHYEVYKVETIGDAYMVVSGLPIRNGDEHARQIARMSLSIRANLKYFLIGHMPSTQLQARIGLHTGSVCAGVVGRKMPRYCLFGDAVNTASRMESTGASMKIQISETTNKCLNNVGDFVMEERGSIEVKGKGMQRTFWLEGEVGWSPFNAEKDLTIERVD